MSLAVSAHLNEVKAEFEKLITERNQFERRVEELNRIIAEHCDAPTAYTGLQVAEERDAALTRVKELEAADNGARLTDVAAVQKVSRELRTQLDAANARVKELEAIVDGLKSENVCRLARELAAAKNRAQLQSVLREQLQEYDTRVNGDDVAARIAVMHHGARMIRLRAALAESEKLP